MTVKTVRKIATGSSDNIFITAPKPKDSRNKVYLYSIEVLNFTKKAAIVDDDLTAYIAEYWNEGNVSSDVCTLIPAVEANQVQWTGRTPWEFPNTLIAEFNDAAAADVIVLGVIYGEEPA